MGEAKPAVPTTRERTIAVVAALGTAARDNAKAGAKALTGDALANLYVRIAAAAAVDDARACLVGLSYVFDETGTLGRVPGTREAVRDLESAEARASRSTVLGAPTMRGRSDWWLHFLVPSALTALLGDRIAGAAGLAKELSDVKGPEGFSFADLLADQAGIVFAQWLLGGEGAEHLASVATRFEGDRFLPEAGDLEDKLTEAQWKEAYGGLTDPRFLKRQGQIRDKVAECAKRWE